MKEIGHVIVAVTESKNYRGHRQAGKEGKRPHSSSQYRTEVYQLAAFLLAWETSVFIVFTSSTLDKAQNGE